MTTLRTAPAFLLLTLAGLLASCDAIPDLPAMSQLTNPKDPISFPTDGVTLSSTVAWLELTPSQVFGAREVAGGDVPLMGGKYWVVGGYNGTTRLTDVWSSTNAIDWTQELGASGVPALSDATLTSYKDELYLIGGTDGTVCFNDVYKSADGLVWTKLTPAPGPTFTARMGHRVVVFNDRLYLLGGSSFSSQLNDEVWWSTDGVTWNNETTSPGFGDRKAFGAVVFDHKLWVIGGVDSNSAPSSEVWSSADGITWTRTDITPTFGARSSPTLVTDGTQMILMFGRGTSSDAGDGFVSADGVRWDRLAMTGAPGARHSAGALAKTGKVYLVGGVTGSGGSATFNNEVWVGALQ